MCEQSGRKRGRVAMLVASLAAAIGVVLAVGAQSATAGVVACSFDAGIAQLTIIVSDANLAGSGADNGINVTRGIGDAILVNGAACIDPVTVQAATTLNTRQVNVLPSATTGADGNDVLTVNETSGRFVPGAPGASDGTTFTTFIPGVADGNGLNELEWWVELGGNRTTSGNQITYMDVNTEGAVTIGSDGAGSFWDGTVPAPPAGVAVSARTSATSGDAMMNINAFPADSDADIFAPLPGTANTLARINVFMGDGDDFVSGKGGSGTGGIATIPLYIDGGGGNDSCQAGLGPDTIVNCEFIDGNSQAISAVVPFQNDVLGQWELGSFFGEVADFSSLPGPLTIVMNENGSLTVTGASFAITAVGIDGVIGSQGDDVIRGNSFDNLLVGCGGNDTISGGDGNDFVDGDNVSLRCSTPGTAGNDTLAGDAGNDTVVGGPADEKPKRETGVSPSTQTNGSDALDGGEGIDTVDYGERTTRVVVYLGLISTFNDGADLNADGLTNEFDDVFFTTENAITGSGQDIVSANFVNNRSDNVFTDNGGNDCLEGGPGNDTFNQSSAPQGADVMIGNTGADTVNYGDRSGAVAVSFDGVANDGDIATNEGDNAGGFSVSCRPQTIVVAPPPYIFDFFFVDGTVSVVPTLIDAPTAGPAPNCFVTVVDGVVDGVLPIIGLRPNGLISPGFVLCDPGETLGGDQAPLRVPDVENANGGSGNDQLYGSQVGNVLNGNAGNDTLDGGASTDQLNGGAGDDTLVGGEGNDALNGGEGVNTADYTSAGTGGVGVKVNLVTGTATGEGNDTLANVQNVRGSSFADALTGDGQDNTLLGFGGADAIAGNSGNDTIGGGAGSDQLSGQGGADKITGSEGADAIQGGAGNDWLQGGQGPDTILGQQGNDSLYGNAQPDFLNGGRGQDICKPGSPGLARGDVVVNCP